MHIVNIGVEKTLVGGEGVGDAVERHRRYGERIGRLNIISYTDRKEGLTTFKISEKVTGHPSNSDSKLKFFFDAVKLFEQIHRENKVDLVVCQDPFMFGLVGWYLKKKYKIKLEINFHGDYWDNNEWLAERIINYLFLFISRMTVPRADGIRVVSSGIKEKLIRAGIDKEKIRVIHTPVDLTPIAEVDERVVKTIREQYQSKKIIIFAGRLAPEKNLAMLIEAFSEVVKQAPDTVLFLAGDGSERQAIEQKLIGLELIGKVEMFGRVEYRDLFKYFKAANIFVHPANHESFGRVLVEAGAAGLPVVATATTGAKEIIKEGENGWLVPIGDKEAMVDKILLMLNDDNLRYSLGQQAEKLAKERFGDTTDELVEFWEWIVNKNDN